ncbi:MAG: dihydroxy-acid dehydratase [Emcibacter sp.]|nr:dihydroxy-acid dehydratase [Emcibacter sp.]
MKKVLRSNFEYGTSRWAVRRAQWIALGLNDEDMKKPKIAVVNSSSELAICFSHLDDIAKTVKDAIKEAGGLPFEIRTTAPSDFIISPGQNGGYILPSRDLIVNDIESVVEGAQLDGMICLTSCDKTVPGHLMAAIRLNIPTILVICGYQPSGEYKGKHVDIEDVFLGAGHVLSGNLSKDELSNMADHAVKGPGVCSGMGTANSMHIVCEALGMCLPGSAPVLANSEKMTEFAKLSSKRIVDMIWEDLKPRDILTKGAFENATSAILAVSGSINAVKHLQAIAVEGDVDLDIFSIFDELSRKTPLLSAVLPVGKDTIESFEKAGGAQAIMKRLEASLDGSVLTVTGKTVKENLASAEVHNDDVIRPLDNVYSDGPAIAILRGNLAPESSIIKLGLSSRKKGLKFTGTAVVFDDQLKAAAAIKSGDIKPGHVIVLRGLGPKGTPGMGGASFAVFAVDGAGLGTTVAVVTDGQLSGLVNKGLVVGEVSPEAAMGGPIALINDGDQISIDIEKRSLTLDVEEQILTERRENLELPTPKKTTGWLAIYRDNVQPMSKGAVIIKK